MTDTNTAQDESAALPSITVLPTPTRHWLAGTLKYSAGGLVILFFWLLFGDFAFQLKDRSVQPTLTLLLKQYHASDLVAGMLIGSLPQIISIFFSPIIAFRSDRHRGPWGRRIPYLLALTPLTVLSMLGLAYSPLMGKWFSSHAGITGDKVDVVVITSFAIFWAAFEFCTVSGLSLFLGLINDVVPRELVGRFFGLFRVFSVAAGIVFMYSLMGKVEQHYLGVFLGIAAVYGVSFTAMCFGVKEPSYPPPPPNTGSPIQTTKTYLRESFTHPYYLWYFASIAIANMAFEPINIFSIYFAKSVGMDMDRYGKLSAIQFAVSLTMSFPLGWLVDKFHPIRLIMIALCFHGTSTLIAFLLVRGPTGFGIAHVICGSLAGFWITAWYALTPALVPRAKFGQYYSAMTMTYCAARFVGGFALGGLFDHLHHQYRYMYLIACLFDFAAVGLTLVVYRYFLRYGGTKNYLAPE